MKRLLLLTTIAAAALALLVYTLLPSSSATAGAPALMDSVNIGDTTSEGGHNLTDWTNVWSGCDWCDLPDLVNNPTGDSTMRLIWGDGGDTCAPSENWATLTLDANPLEVGQILTVHHLDGAADDGFKVYVNSDLVGTYIDAYSTNTWVTTDFDMSAGGYTGSLTIMLEATAPAWGGCGTWGQVAFSWIELWGGPIPVDVDIKPGSDPNCINNDGHGVIPVAILGSATFDVTTLDAGTVRLEDLVVKAVGKSNKLLAHVENVNGDVYDDLVVQIEDGDGAFANGNGTATVRGNLKAGFGGTMIEGSDEICIVP